MPLRNRGHEIVILYETQADPDDGVWIASDRDDVIDLGAF